MVSLSIGQIMNNSLNSQQSACSWWETLYMIRVRTFKSRSRLPGIMTIDSNLSLMIFFVKVHKLFVLLISFIIFHIFLKKTLILKCWFRAITAVGKIQCDTTLPKTTVFARSSGIRQNLTGRETSGRFPWRRYPEKCTNAKTPALHIKRPREKPTSPICARFTTFTLECLKWESSTIPTIPFPFLRRRFCKTFTHSPRNPIPIPLRPLRCHLKLPCIPLSMDFLDLDLIFPRFHKGTECSQASQDSIPSRRDLTRFPLISPPSATPRPRSIRASPPPKDRSLTIRATKFRRAKLPTFPTRPTRPGRSMPRKFRMTSGRPRWTHVTPKPNRESRECSNTNQNWIDQF